MLQLSESQNIFPKYVNKMIVILSDPLSSVKTLMLSIISFAVSVWQQNVTADSKQWIKVMSTRVSPKLVKNHLL